MTLPIRSIVNVSISAVPVAPSAPGFGTMAVVTDENNIGGDLPVNKINFFASMTEVALIYASSTEVYKAMQAYFAQTPQPQKAASLTHYASGNVGTLLGGYGVTTVIGTWNAITTGSFAISINGVAADITGLDFSLDANMDDVATAIEAGIQAIGTGGFTAATCTFDSVNNAFVVKTGNVNETISVASVAASGVDISVLTKLQTGDATAYAGNPVQTITDALDAAEQVSTDWYGVVILKKHRDIQAAKDVAAWVESRVKIFVSTTNNPLTLVVGDATTTAYDLFTANYGKTMGIYSSYADEYPEAAAFGIAFTTDFTSPNSVITLKFKVFKGISSEDLNSTQKTALDDIRCNASMNIGSTSMFAEGTMYEGLFFDERHSIDWLNGSIESNVFGYLATRTTKVPLTDVGGASLQQQVIRSLDAAVNNGMLAAGYTSDNTFLPNGYVVTTQRVADMSIADKSNRIAPTITFTALLASAVHFVVVTGTVER